MKKIIALAIMAMGLFAVQPVLASEEAAPAADAAAAAPAAEGEAAPAAEGEVAPTEGEAAAQ